MKLIKITLMSILFCTVACASAEVVGKCNAKKVVYETDGHYWTVLLVATMLKIPEAKAIAYAAEYPDNVINDSGDIVRARYTYLYPKPQKKVHALTGGDPEHERAVSINLFSWATTTQEKGIACHRLGDSFAHTNDKTGKMFPHIIAHVFQWKKPDKVRSNANKYLSYVIKLVDGLGGRGSEINMTVFEYIARSGLSSSLNSAILKAEYNLLIGSITFNIKKDELPVVEKYLSERINAESYAVHSKYDGKGRETTAIVFIKNTSLASGSGIK